LVDVINVSEKPAVCTFRVKEDGDSRLLRNFDNCLSGIMASHLEKKMILHYEFAFINIGRFQSPAALFHVQREVVPVLS
jgi:hypothetical protein